MTTLTADLSTEIRRANDRFESAFARQNAAGLAQLYTEDDMLLPTGSDIIEGLPAIERFWQGAMDAGIREAKLKTLELEHHGETTIEIGAYVLRDEGGQELDRGKYVVVWQRVNGQWKLRRDIWNSSLPQTQP